MYVFNQAFLRLCQKHLQKTKDQLFRLNTPQSHTFHGRKKINNILGRTKQASKQLRIPVTINKSMYKVVTHNSFLLWILHKKHTCNTVQYR